MRRVPWVILGFILFYTGGVFLGWFLLPLIRLISWKKALGEKRCQRVVAKAFGVLFAYLEWIRLYSVGMFSLENFEKLQLRIDGGAVVIANHPTLLDIVLVISQLGYGTIVIKPLYYYNPLLGLLAWSCGYIRGGKTMGRGAAIIQEATRRAKAGEVVVIFPEGTRSDPGELKPFHRGAFRIAEQANVPLAPIWMTCTPRVLGRGQGFRGYPKKDRVKLYGFPFWDDKLDYFVYDARTSALEWEERYHDAERNMEMLNAM